MNNEERMDFIYFISDCIDDNKQYEDDGSEWVHKSGVAEDILKIYDVTKKKA